MKTLLQKTAKSISLIIILLSCNYVRSQTVINNTPGNYSFVVPAGIYSISVETWGAGGGGGNSNNNTNNGGSGGGGGAYAKGTHTVVPGNIYYYSVGTKGTGGPASSTAVPTAGSSSWFNAVANVNSAPVSNANGTLARGGGAGVNDSSVTPTNGGLNSTSYGNITTASGSNGTAGSSNGGGNGGAGASPGGGAGGIGATSSGTNGTAGTIPGGGGGGSDDTKTSKGGDGANGQIIITYNVASMNVKGNSITIPNGDTNPSIADWTDFVSTNVNSPILRTYTIENLGNINLNLTGTPIVTSSNPDFTIAIQPTTPIAPSGTTSFRVVFNPTTVGVKTATISIANNDALKNPYTFKITGIGIQAFGDSDGDGVYNNVDLDDDNDGIPDNVEQNYTSGSTLATTLDVTLLNETFGAGTIRTRINTNIPTASTTYCYEDGTTAQAADECDTAIDLNDGQYTVNYQSGTAAVASWASQYWYQGTDHTVDTNGRMALFNATSDITDEFYRTVVQGVIINAPLTYSFWILNLDRADAPGIATRNRPNITVEFRDLSNNLISVINTLDIAPSAATPTSTDWKQFSATFTPLTTGFSIIFKNNQLGGTGNDLALDDILITQKLTDTDGDGTANVYDLDSDNDGIGGIVEDGWASLSNGKDRMDLTAGTWIDANGNGWHDTVETFYNTGGTSKNFDGDNVPNYIDLDSDNDSLFDVDEATDFSNAYKNGDGDINGDGVGDGTDGTDNDGILTAFDTLPSSYGSTGKPNPKNTTGIGNADFIKLQSQSGVNDISTTLYASLDANLDGKIDDATDIDRDGIPDSFDTNTALYGSPRNLNRKLELDFDGRNDYGQENVQILDNLSSASLMAWIDLNSAFSTDGVIIGQNKFQIRVTSARNIEAVVNSTVLTYSAVALNTSQWYHVGAVYGGGTLKLFLNGTMVASVAASGNIISDGSKLTIGKDASTNTKYFKGKLDEVRVFNVALADVYFQRMVYQEIQNVSSQTRGKTVPVDVGVSFANVLRCYSMDAYKDDIIDDITTTAIDVTGMKIYNNKNIYVQQAPMPFVTERTGNFATAVNSPTNEVRGLDIMDQDWSIVQVKHDITETTNNIDLGMIVDAGVTVTMNNDTKIQNDWYLLLNGKIDLQGKSQLLQTVSSTLDATSAGSIERDQQGTKNLYNYNYWASPVGTINATTNNNSFTVAGVMKDGTSGTPQNITWTSGVNGSPTSPITLSSYWIFKFQNLSNSYANWASVGQNGTLNAAQGFTLKGSGTASANQNYTFVGKPNNGTITTTVAAGNLNLTGNPYPSALDSANFIIANTTSTTGTLYFWEHASSNNTHNLVNYQGGYSVRNLVGGTGPTAPAGINGLGTSTKIPGRYVPVGQGFFMVGSSTGGNITFNNNQRLFIKEDNAASTYMFKNTNTNIVANTNTEDPITSDTFKRVRLGLTSKDNYHRQILLGFMDQYATSAVESGYDAPSIDNQLNDMYFINSGAKLNIEGEGYFDVNNVYPIGIKTNVFGEVKIMVDATENMNSNQRLFILDNTDGQYHDITNNPYIVELPQGLTDNRFTLTFKDNHSLLSNDEVDLNTGITIAYANTSNILNIKNNVVDATVEKVTLFNLLGQLVATFDVKDQNQQNIQLPIKDLSSGTYIVKVKTDKGETSRKIVFN